ncbi:MAG: DNA-formamidopyrimidine glycosylase family protein [Planctomycetota bacterium]|nr:DNA-formamidopyrimidine glycosylase family protein [Planctomycetota bacterium]
MPELPDVAGFQSYLESTALHQKIARVSISDDRIIHDVSPRTLRRRLKGRCFQMVSRHGKYLFVHLDDDAGWLVFHFGMTGELDYGKTEGEAPAFTRAAFEFDHEYRLAYISRRMLGRITLTDDRARFIEEQELGPDALADDLNGRRFRALLGNRRGPAKHVLMDQSLIAGIGNVYADEILFRLRWHPRIRIADLGDDEIGALFRAMRRALRTAAERGGDPARLPRSFMLPHREGDGRCPECGTALETMTISGRTSYFCARCQTS